MTDLRFDPHAGFNGVLGLTWDHVASDRVAVSLEVTEALHQPYGIVHGGVYCSVIEAICSVGAATWALERGIAGVVGVSNSTDFLRAHRTGSLEAVATPIHQGRSYQLWQTVISRTSDGKPVARGQVRLQHIDDPAAAGRPAPVE
jgi:uncharacterized protein (TIGR00369 family)